MAGAAEGTGTTPAVTVTVGTTEPAKLNEGQQGTPATTTPAAGTQPSGADDPTLADSEALRQRLERERKKTMRDLGIASPDEHKKSMDRLKELEEGEKQRQLAAMSEQERLTKQLEDERAEKAQIQADLLRERETNMLNGIFQKKGIKNADYANFLVSQAKARANGGAVDFDAVLTEAMGDQRTRVALGIDEAATPSAPGTAPTTTPATTTPSVGGAPPKPTSNGANPVPDMRNATPEQWAAWKKQHGMF